MHLGIIVVYMVKEENEKLLELHLNKIRTLTHVPYTIFAGVNDQLLPKFRLRLEAEPNVKICPLPQTDLHDYREHSFYLELLTKQAVVESSHLVILHVDSFPISKNWINALLTAVETGSVIVTISRNHFLHHYSACLFFTGEFYRSHQPSFLISDTERSSSEYLRFNQRCPHHENESGEGYVYRVFCQSLSWSSLERSNVGEDKGHFGSIYGDIIFHLEGAFHFQQFSRWERFFSFEVIWRGCLWFKEVIRIFIPQKWLQKISHITYPISCFWERPFYYRVRAQLLDHPEKYISFLQTGNKTVRHNRK